MKFFTPDLYVRLQSSDEQAMRSADADWERAVDGYESRLSKIRQSLPESVPTLIDRYDFHDARVLSLARENGTFVVVLEPESPPRELVILVYQLTDEPRVDTGLLPDGLRAPNAEWLYDEWNVLDEPNLFSHEILLNNGWAIEVRFDKITVISAHELLHRHDWASPIDDHPMAQPA